MGSSSESSSSAVSPVRASARSASRNDGARAASATTVVRLGAAEAGGESERDALGDDESAARVEVRPHPLGVHVQAGDRVRRGGRRSAGERESAGQRLPLGMPGADRTLVLVGEAAEQHGCVRVREPGSMRPQAWSETGLRFCGIVEDPPADASATSLTSVCASSATSRPTFAAAPAAPSSAAPSSATR